MIIENSLLLILLLIFFLLLFHYLFFLIKIIRGIKKLSPITSNDKPEEFISIIIPFRNEAENILSNLKSIELQNYSVENYEVIYVNDSSEDNSLEILLKNISAPNIKVISVPEDFSPSAHKKRAIRYGIENSKGEIIVTSDADCTYKPGWLKILVGHFEFNTGFVSGPVEFSGAKSIFSRIQQLEFAGLVLTGAGLISAGNPTICNAANIAYRKKVFDLVGGFKNQMNLSSGDDELLMQKIAKDTNYLVRFSVNKETIVSTSANKTLKDFYQQRKRWASKGLFYQDKFLVIKLLLIYLFYLSLAIQPALIISGNSIFTFSFALSVLFKLIPEYKILSQGKKKLFSGLPLKLFFIAELLHVPYIILAGMFGSFGYYSWKQRHIKR